MPSTATHTAMLLPSTEDTVGEAGDRVLVGARVYAKHLTPDAIAGILECDYDTVLGWIRSGELPAIGVGKNGRHPYRIAPSAFDRFYEQRLVVAPAARLHVVDAQEAPPRAAGTAAPRSATIPSGKPTRPKGSVRPRPVEIISSI